MNLAQEFGVKINTILTSIEEYRGVKEGFDAVLCFYFLDRSINSKIVNLIKPGGLLIIETYTEGESQKRDFFKQKFPKSFLVKSQELLTMFPQMKILKYEEPLHNRELTASIIHQKINRNIFSLLIKNELE
jgi:2-polyprenyl-3-methyl-5-hydroxy-6-metoxy-1,4-benzoquinol methylase